MAARVALAFDIGATNVRGCVGTADGFIINRAAAEIKGISSNEEFLSRLEELAQKVGKGYSMEEIAGIGIGTVGPLDSREGVIKEPANLPVKDVPIVKHFADLTGREVVLLNDGNAAAWGEYIYGVGKQTRDIVHIAIGTGIGGGAVLDGKLILGKDGNALEIGHIIVDPEGSLACGCGQRGHWEAYCSGSGIPRLAHRETERLRAEGKSDKSLLDEIQPLSSEAIFNAARAGDWLAQHVIARVSNYNLIAITNLSHLFDPMLITVGGAVTLRNSELLIEPLKRSLSSKVIVRPPTLTLTPLGEDATLLGAIASVFRPPF